MKNIQIGPLSACSHSWHKNADSFLPVRALKTFAAFLKAVFYGYSVSITSVETYNLNNLHPQAWFAVELRQRRVTLAVPPAHAAECKLALTKLIQEHTDEIDKMLIKKMAWGERDASQHEVSDQDIRDMKKMFRDDLQVCQEWCMEQMNKCQPGSFVDQFLKCSQFLQDFRNARYALARLLPPGETKKQFFPGRTGFINHDNRQCTFISETLAAFHEGIADYFILRPLPAPPPFTDEAIDIKTLENQLREAQENLKLEQQSKNNIARNHRNGTYGCDAGADNYAQSCIKSNQRNIAMLQELIDSLNTKLTQTKIQKDEIERNNREFRQLTDLKAKQDKWLNIRKIILFQKRSGVQFPGSVNNDLIPEKYQLVSKVFPNPATNSQQMKDFLSGDWHALAVGGGMHCWSYIKSYDGTIDCINDQTVRMRSFKNSEELYKHFSTINWAKQQVNYYA